MPDIGAVLLGLNTTVLPAIRAAAVGPAHRAIGKLNGLITAKTPSGRMIERVWTAASPEVVHRVVVAVVALHDVGVVAQQVGRLLDLAERLEAALADLDRHVRRRRPSGAG